MKEQVLVLEYARAIYNFSGPDIDATVAFFERISEALTSNPDFARFAVHPAIDMAAKKVMFLEVGNGPKNDMISGIIGNLITKNRTQIIGSITIELKTLRNKAANIASVQVLSATALTKGEENQLASSISAYLKKKVAIDFSVNPALLAGYVIKIGTMVIDNTISRQLTTLQSELIGLSQG